MIEFPKPIYVKELFLIDMETCCYERMDDAKIYIGLDFYEKQLCASPGRSALNLPATGLYTCPTPMVGDKLIIEKPKTATSRELNIQGIRLYSLTHNTHKVDHYYTTLTQMAGTNPGIDPLWAFDIIAAFNFGGIATPATSGGGMSQWNG